MRFTIVNTIYEEALKNPNLYFITGDLGHIYVEEFKKNLPDQYINAGISEQNIVGMAAGLALSGMKVVIYSIVPFITMRCYEQIKTDVCYQNLDVTIVGVGRGFAYGPFANTHCSIEDIGIMRVLPNMKIVCPANPLDTEQLTRQALKINGPTYIGIGRGKEPMPENIYEVKFGKGVVLKKGTDITIFTTGTITEEALKTASLLDKENISTEVILIHTIKPLDKIIVQERLNRRKGVFTIEEHNIMGGLGSAIAEIIAENSHKDIVFKRIGVQDKYLDVIGSTQFLRKKHKINADFCSITIENSLLKNE